MGSGVLSVVSLEKNFGKKRAVKNISLSMRQGEVIGLLGPNGAGKTTSFYIIAGFLKPTSGTVILDQENITKLSMYKRALRGISYLPQETSVFRSLSVEDNILATLEYKKGISRKERQYIVDKLLDELDITALRKQKASTLSGGERRRTEIARSLTVNPKFLLLDEPFAGIDPIAVSEIKDLIRDLAHRDIGILITDHNVRDALEVTDRSYVVNLGEILISGTRDELIVNEEARRIYLGRDFSM